MSVTQGLHLPVSQSFVKTPSVHTQPGCSAYFVSMCYIYFALENRPLVWSCTVLCFSLKMQFQLGIAAGLPKAQQPFLFKRGYIWFLCSCSMLEVCVQHSCSFGLPESWTFPDTAVKHRVHLFLKVHIRAGSALSMSNLS